MECLKISIGNTTPTDDRSLEEFIGSDKARTSFGQLVITLAQRHVLADYTFYANVRDDDQSLLINHKTHFPHLGEAYVFFANQQNVSLRAVEDALRDHLHNMQENLKHGLLRLQKDIRDIGEAAEQIVVARARIAVGSAFPEIEELKWIPNDKFSEFYVFSSTKDEKCLYIARAVNSRFNHGVIQLDRSIYWGQMEDGIGFNQRHYLFWTELSIAFASRELQIPENKLRYHGGTVSVKQKPTEVWCVDSNIDMYTVENVTLRITDDDLAVIEFDADNLPNNAYVAASAHKRAAEFYRDKHMTPSI